MIKNIISKRSVLIIASLILVICAAVGATVAYLIDRTDPVTNTFVPAAFELTVNEDFEKGGLEKKDVFFTNTGDTEAFVRTAVVINWQNAAGEVYAGLPAEGTDYTVDINETDWKLADDGYYYLVNEVGAGEDTPVFINSLSVIGEAPADGYTLSVDVLATAVQSNPDSAVSDAWGMTAQDGVLNVQ